MLCILYFVNLKIKIFKKKKNNKNYCVRLAHGIASSTRDGVVFSQPDMVLIERWKKWDKVEVSGEMISRTKAINHWLLISRYTRVVHTLTQLGERHTGGNSAKLTHETLAVFLPRFILGSAAEYFRTEIPRVWRPLIWRVSYVIFFIIPVKPVVRAVGDGIRFTFERARCGWVSSSWTCIVTGKPLICGDGCVRTWMAGIDEGNKKKIAYLFLKVTNSG